MTPTVEQIIDVFHSRPDARPYLWSADWDVLYDWSCEIGIPMSGPWLFGVSVAMPGTPGVLRAHWEDGHTVDLPLTATPQPDNPYRRKEPA